MRKFIASVVVALVVLFGMGSYIYKTNKIIESYENQENKESKKELLSMMLETESGSGKYQETTANEWPTEGYVFNEAKSGCENGGTLSWDDEKKNVIMEGNGADKCYVYFDRYNSVTINESSIKLNGNSIIITFNATPGTGDIAKYFYSIDDGKNYIESTSNTYTFSDLEKGTYNVKAYIQDTLLINTKIITKTIIINDTFSVYIKSLYTGTQGENNLYLHNSSLTNSSSDGSYRYSGSDYKLSEKATSAGFKEIYSTSSASTTGIINFYCNDTKQYVGYTCDKTSYYALQYDTENTQYNNISVLQQAVTDGYLIRDDIKNYVCFGYDSSNGKCPSDNLYRIVGVFGDYVKLIKYDYAKPSLLGTDGAYYNTYASTGREGITRGTNTTSEIGGYYWSAGSNTWSSSTLNTINLNKNFLNNIGSDWANKISVHTWSVKGLGWNSKYGYWYGDRSPKSVYSSELSNYLTVDAKVGITYLSDYGYAASPNAWNYLLANYDDQISVNWMYMGLWEWTITPNPRYSDYSYNIVSDGNVETDYVNTSEYGTSRYPLAIRPCFYLNTNVTYVQGNGSKNTPFIIT